MDAREVTPPRGRSLHRRGSPGSADVPSMGSPDGSEAPQSTPPGHRTRSRSHSTDARSLRSRSQSAGTVGRMASTTTDRKRKPTGTKDFQDMLPKRKKTEKPAASVPRPPVRAKSVDTGRKRRRDNDVEVVGGERSASVEPFSVDSSDEDYVPATGRGRARSSSMSSSRALGGDTSSPESVRSEHRYPKARMKQLKKKQRLEMFQPSTSEVNDGMAKRNTVNTKAATAESREPCAKDRYCWSCHRDGRQMIQCTACPRVFHLRCTKLTDLPAVDDGWVCQICRSISDMERSDTRVGRIPLEQLCFLFSYTIQSMKKCEGSEPFWKAVDTSVHEFYRHYVAYPMDLALLEENVRRKSYGSTEAFEADAKWILHNCTVFNTPQHNLTVVAKRLMRVCSAAMNAIESCPDCYLRSFRYPDEYFTEICPAPHLPVWAKLKGFPYWPAKVMRMRGDEIEVRFFGDHDRSYIQVKDCYLYSKSAPTVQHYKKGYDKLRDAVDEMNDYIAKLKTEFGKFCYAELRTQFDPNKQMEQLVACIPNYKRETGTANVDPGKTDPQPPATTPVTRDIRVPALMNMDDIAAVLDIDKARSKVPPPAPDSSPAASPEDEQPRSVSVSAWDEFQSVNGINIINVMTIEKSAFDRVADEEEDDGSRCYALSDGESRSPARGRSPPVPRIKVVDASSLMARARISPTLEDCDTTEEEKEGAGFRPHGKRGGFFSKRFGIVRERDGGSPKPEHAYSRVGDVVDCTRSSAEETSDGDSRLSVASLSDAGDTTSHAVGPSPQRSNIFSIAPDPHAVDPLACDADSVAPDVVTRDKAFDDVVVINDCPAVGELKLPAAVRQSNQVVVVPVVKDKAKGSRDEVVVVPVVKDKAKGSRDEVVVVPVVEDKAKGSRDEVVEVPVVEDKAKESRDEVVEVPVVGDKAKGSGDEVVVVQPTKESQQQPPKAFAGGGSSEGAVAAVSGGDRTETYLDPKTGDLRSIFLPEGAAGSSCASPPAALEGESFTPMYLDSGGGVTISVADRGGGRQRPFAARELGATVNLSKAISLSVIKGRRREDVTLANLLNAPPSSSPSPTQNARKTLSGRRDSGADGRRSSSGSERASASPSAGVARRPPPMVVIPATTVGGRTGSGISQYTAGSSLPLNLLQAQVSGVRAEGGGAQSKFSPAPAAAVTPQMRPRAYQHEPPIPPDAWSISVQQQVLQVIYRAIQERAANDPKAALALMQSELNKQNYLHAQEMKELKHHFNQSFSESQASFASALEQSRQSLTREHQRSNEESRRLHERCRELEKRCGELQRAVEQAKKKQWCTVCGEEAQLYCCWNTSYCDYACQEDHWQVHMEVCRQKEQNSEEPEPQEVGPIPNNNNNNNNTSPNNGISLKPSTLYQGTTMLNKSRQLATPIRTPTPPLRPINQFPHAQRIVREGEPPLIRVGVTSASGGPQSPPPAPRFTMMTSRVPTPSRVMAGPSRPAPYPLNVPRPPQVSRAINTSTTSTTCSSATGPVTPALYKLSNPLKPNTGQRFINIGSQKYVVVESNSAGGDKSIMIAKPVQQVGKVSSPATSSQDGMIMIAKPVQQVGKVSATATSPQGDKSNVIAKPVQQVGKESSPATSSQDGMIMIAKSVQQVGKVSATATSPQGDKSNVIAKPVQQVGKESFPATSSQDGMIMIAKPVQQVGKVSATTTSPQGDKSNAIAKPVQQLDKESSHATSSQGDMINIAKPVQQLDKESSHATSLQGDMSNMATITESVKPTAMLGPGEVLPLKNGTWAGGSGVEGGGGEKLAPPGTSERTSKGTSENAPSPAPRPTEEKDPGGFELALTQLFGGYESSASSPPPERSTFDLEPATGLTSAGDEGSSSPAE